jgi:prepilin-type N-terminal cleavage/methylation domain-containing protein/prepilin-type processing-associated H-X9-DG protein
MSGTGPVRRGTSLIEVLVAVAIVGILSAMVICAVQKARVAAAQADDKNRMRQITLALHGYAAARQGQLPGRKVPSVYTDIDIANSSPLLNIYPHLSGNSYLKKVKRQYPVLREYISPLDPSLVGPTPLEQWGEPPCSYVVNQQVFGAPSRLDATIRDGLSTTLFLTTRFSRCIFHSPQINAGVDTSYTYLEPYEPLSPNPWSFRRSCTVADPSWRDVVPVTTDGVTVPSEPGWTFQDAPRVRVSADDPTTGEADSRVAHSWRAGGLHVAFFDGSVRTLPPSIPESAYWPLFTPSGGEVVSAE